ncbi:MAG: flagellar biosynthesis anti-sigma factor FlgM [Desulfobacteraceae bacterium]|jgi:flagellar biosynthesis anti-sigma factor FlgM
MKVADQNTPIQLDAYIRQARQQQIKPDVSPGRSGAVDKVQLSDQAKQIQKAAQEANKVSDVREDKVRETKMEVEKGTYKVVGEQVANDMLKESFENDIILHKINTRA